MQVATSYPTIPCAQISLKLSTPNYHMWPWTQKMRIDCCSLQSRQRVFLNLLLYLRIYCNIIPHVSNFRNGPSPLHVHVLKIHLRCQFWAPSLRIMTATPNLDMSHSHICRYSYQGRYFQFYVFLCNYQKCLSSFSHGSIFAVIQTRSRNFITILLVVDERYLKNLKGHIFLPFHCLSFEPHIMEESKCGASVAHFILLMVIFTYVFFSRVWPCM